MSANFYRNKVELQGIDPEALWLEVDGMLVLVDEDQYVKEKHSEDDFYPVPEPEQMKGNTI